MAVLKLQYFLLICVLYQVYLTTAEDTSKRVVCYHYNMDDEIDIPPNLCTHIIFEYAWPEGNELISSNKDDTERYNKIMKLKKRNKNLKVLLSLPQKTLIGKSFKKMILTDTNIKKFAKSAREYLERYGFDGLVYTCEFEIRLDKANYTKLYEITRKEFCKSKKYLLITTLISPFKIAIDMYYEFDKIMKVLDFVILMTFNFYDETNSVIVHSSSLYPSKQEGPNKELNVAYVAQLLVSLGVPKQKMVVGIASGGTISKILNSNQTNPGDPATVDLIKGRFITYPEVCELLPNATKIVWDDNMQVPYAIIDDQFVAYDDIKSVIKKADFINQNGYGGAMIWNLGIEEKSEKSCGMGKYPLITAIDVKIRGGKNEDYLSDF